MARSVAQLAALDRAANTRARVVGLAGRAVLGTLLVLLALVWLAPIVWTVSTSLRTPAQSFSLPPKWLPTDWAVGNYGQVFERVPFAQILANSVKVSLAIVLGQLVAASMAGYAFARLRFPGGRRGSSIAAPSLAVWGARRARGPRFLALRRVTGRPGRANRAGHPMAPARDPRRRGPGHALNHPDGRPNGPHVLSFRPAGVRQRPTPNCSGFPVVRRRGRRLWSEHHDGHTVPSFRGVRGGAGRRAGVRAAAPPAALLGARPPSRAGGRGAARAGGDGHHCADEPLPALRSDL